MQVTALFVENGGSYFNVNDIDPWDEARDARLYTGTDPVVAHPPCNLWCKMAPINYKRWKKEDLRPGNDNGCFRSALDNVNRCGGVLEHPAQTYAWAAHGLVRPPTVGGGWGRSGEGWVCVVWQSAYGHRANKATWLYYKGRRPPFDLNWSKVVGTHQIGQFDQRGKAANKPTVGKREASSTPAAFRAVLLRLARHSRGQ